jgi:ABC-type polysaccharide/polyol phosphate export permease
VIAQAGLFVAPIIYPIGVLPERFHYLVYLWPPTPVIEFSRSVLIEGVVPTARAHALLVLAAAASLGPRRARLPKPRAEHARASLR